MKSFLLTLCLMLGTTATLSACSSAASKAEIELKKQEKHKHQLEKAQEGFDDLKNEVESY